MKEPMGNLITELLFGMAAHRRFSREGIHEELIKCGVEPDLSDSFMVFRYHDMEEFFCRVMFSASSGVIAISLCLIMPDDENGWFGWSERVEGERLKRQMNWLTMKGISLSAAGGRSISNCYSPKDGSSRITISFVDPKI